MGKKWGCCEWFICLCVTTFVILGIVIGIVVLVSKENNEGDDNSPFTLKIPLCPKNVSFSQFVQTQNGKPPTEATIGNVCYNEDYIQFQITANDDYIYNPYTECNDQLYQYDVVEVFITPTESKDTDVVVKHYLEVEVSPFNVLFVSNITNESDSCEDFSGVNLDCASSGIVFSTEITKIGFVTTISIPFDLIGNSEYYRFNVFRIDTFETTSTDYQAWSPTYLRPACFHVPADFGLGILK